MKKRARAIILQDDRLLAIKRIKNNETYFVLPGGGVHDGEDEKMALVRECREEINVGVAVGDLIIRQSFNGDEEAFYLCEIISGIVGQGSGEEYEKISQDNFYEPTWLPIDEIDSSGLRPLEIIDIIRKY